MKFKTKKTSETGKKFMAVKERADSCFAAARELNAEVGAEQWRGTYAVFGGISAFMFNNDYVAPKWMKKIGKNEYKPLGNRKEGKALQAKMDALPVVTRRQLNICIGFNDRLSTIGFDWENDEYALFHISEKWGIKIPDDCTEITTTEYNQLAKS